MTMLPKVLRPACNERQEAEGGNEGFQVIVGAVVILIFSNAKKALLDFDCKIASGCLLSHFKCIFWIECAGV